MRIFVIALLAILAGCSTPSAEQSSPPKVVSSHPAPKDLASKFSSQGQTGMKLVQDHLLGKDFMPGGNLADYKTENGTFEMFLLEAPDARKAAFMLLDWKAAMPDAKYLAHMGGYFGLDQGRPVYIFSKDAYLAGIVGLPQEKADIEARRFAERL